MRILLLFVLLGTVLLGGCKAAPTKQSVPAAPDAKSPSGPNAGPLVDPRPPNVPPEVRPPGFQEPPLGDKKQAQHLALEAANLLDEGKEAEARAKVTEALTLDGRNDLTLLLISTITDDPVKVFGTKSFPYTVRPGDKLSKISEQFLRDQYKFYLLARYNNISVPRSLRAGTVIKIPGTPPVLPPSQPPPGPISPVGKPQSPAHPDSRYQEGLQLLATGDKDRAYDAFLQAWKSDAGNQQARIQVETLRPELVRTHDRSAREAFRRQDLDASIKEWDRVLQVDPGNETARLERQRSVELKKHFEEVK